MMLAVTILGTIDTIFSRIFPNYRPTIISEILPDWWTWQIWVMVILFISLIATLETAYRKIRQINKQLGVGVVETDPDPHDPNQLKLIDSFPKDNESITKKEVKKIFLKFNKPIHRENMNEALISNYYVRCNMVCQWNICGWVEYDEGDTKLIWHVREDTLQHREQYGPMEPYDYPMFEIRIPHGETQRRLRAADGSRLARTVIRVKIKPDTTKLPVWEF